jgi:hypothetical protein
VRPPIVVFEGKDVSFFPDSGAAAAALEGPDVYQGIYQAYDADAQCLVLRSTGGPTDYSAAVVVEDSDTRHVDVNGLQKLLRQYLVGRGGTVPDDTPVAALLDLAVAISRPGR